VVRETRGPPRALVWSFGGGVQSVAIAVLVARGTLPRPEAVVMADTGYEATETWDYLERVVRGTLGIDVQVAPRSLAKVDLYSHCGKVLLPLFTEAGGKLPGFCSNEWKKSVVRRWLRLEGYGPRRPVKLWLGISVDEVMRAKPSGVDWIENSWPLFHSVTRRGECYALIRSEGLPQPPRSSCFICPNRGNGQWRRLKNHPSKDWENARRVEREIQEKEAGLFLHCQRVPLGEVDLNESQGSLFDGCEEGYCFS